MARYTMRYTARCRARYTGMLHWQVTPARYTGKARYLVKQRLRFQNLVVQTYTDYARLPLEPLKTKMAWEAMLTAGVN